MLNIKHYEIGSLAQYARVDPPAAVSTTALHSKASASIVMFNDVEHPANGTSSSLDKLPWQMRTVEFVRRLASV